MRLGGLGLRVGALARERQLVAVEQELDVLLLEARKLHQEHPVGLGLERIDSRRPVAGGDRGGPERLLELGAQVVEGAQKRRGDVLPAVETIHRRASVYERGAVKSC
ncbi:hypothetical protein D3C87_1657770 [compost metagenome]